MTSVIKADITALNAAIGDLQHHAEGRGGRHDGQSGQHSGTVVDALKARPATEACFAGERPGSGLPRPGPPPGPPRVRRPSLLCCARRWTVARRACRAG